MVNGVNGNCEVAWSSKSEFSFHSQDALTARADGPDVSGDGAPDVLTPLTLKLTWKGAPETCTKMLASQFPPVMRDRLSASEGALDIPVYELSGLSVSGMEKLSGDPWSMYGRRLIKQGVMFANGGILDSARIIMETPMVPIGQPEEHSFDSGPVKTSAGGYEWTSETSETSVTTHGKLDENKLPTITQIANSQIRGAVKIPAGPGKEVYIGKTVLVRFKGEVPKIYKDNYNADMTGSTLKARVIDIHRLYYTKSDVGYSLLMGQILVEVAPFSEENLTKTQYYQLFPDEIDDYEIVVE